MKKFYALLVASLAASAISASAALPLQHGRSRENVTVHQIDQLKTIDQITVEKKSGFKHITDIASRAEEGALDVSKVSQYMYYDYFFNWTEEDGVTDINEDDGFRYIQSACEVELEDNGDGTVTIRNIFGLSGLEIEMKETEDGYILEMGQNCGEVTLNDGSVGQLYLATINDAGVDIQDAYELPTYSNAIGLPSYLGLYVMRGRQGLGFYCLNVFNVLVQPNSTLTYGILTDNGVEECKTTVYCEYAEPAEDVDPDSDEYFDPYLMISNIMPWNDGCSVKFEFLDIRGEYCILAMDQIAYPSYYNQAGEPSGDWYMSSAAINADPTTSADGIYFSTVFADETDEGLTWPVANETFNIDAVNWFLNSVNGYVLPLFTKATLALGKVDDGGESGVSDIIKDNSAVSAPVYYNIQGMQIANPQPGQLYIVKQGNKVSKVIK